MGKNIKAEVSNKIKQDVKKMSKRLASKTFQIKKGIPPQVWVFGRLFATVYAPIIP